MPTVDKKAKVTDVEVSIDGIPSGEAFREQKLAAIAKLNEQCRQQINSGLGNSNASSNDEDVDESTTSFEEPDETALQAALDDIESRVGLPEQEYAEKYNLQNVDVDFAAFEKRLRDAPTEKRVRIVEAHQRGDNLVLFCQKDSGECGLMNPRQVTRELVNREFNQWGARFNGRDPEQSQVSILRARGLEPATKKDALHVTACDSDSCEGVYWLTLAPREGMTPEELDNTRWAAGFVRKVGGTVVSGNGTPDHFPDLGGLRVLWV